MADVNFRKWTVYFVTHIHEYDNSKDVADFLPQRLKEKGIFRVQSLEFSKVLPNISENLVVF